MKIPLTSKSSSYKIMVFQFSNYIFFLVICFWLENDNSKFKCTSNSLHHYVQIFVAYGNFKYFIFKRNHNNCNDCMVKYISINPTYMLYLDILLQKLNEVPHIKNPKAKPPPVIQLMI